VKFSDGRRPHPKKFKAVFILTVSALAARILKKSEIFFKMATISSDSFHDHFS